MKTDLAKTNDVDRTENGLAARLAFGTARRLGSVTRTACEGFWGVGRLIWGGHKDVTRHSRATERRPPSGEPVAAGTPPAAGGCPPVEEFSPVGEEPMLTEEDIRSIVVEELARRQAAAGGASVLELQERLRCMAEAVEILQKRVNELSSRGASGDAEDTWRESNSLDAIGSLTSDERVLLAGVFRRNVALQRRSPAGAAGDGSGSQPP